MKLAKGSASRVVHIRFFTVAIYLALAVTPAAYGQEPDAFYDSATEDDKVRARSMLQLALETRQSQQMAPWRNEATGDSGTITPLRTFRIKSGFFCRDFRETLKMVGSLTERVGTACRREDGVWIRVER